MGRRSLHRHHRGRGRLRTYLLTYLGAGALCTAISKGEAGGLRKLRDAQNGEGSGQSDGGGEDFVFHYDRISLHNGS